jgi:protein tyrosine/serine phosphatase
MTRISRRKSIGRGLSALLALPLLIATAYAGGAAAAGSPSEIIATHYSSMGPLKLSGVNISNFGVVDGRIFRGAQPKGQDYSALKAVGVTTIIDLREDARKDSRSEAEAAGLKYVNIPLVDKQTPTEENAAAFLKAVDDPANGVVYVHCAGGRHRTGSMIAVYRMTHDKWTLDQAYDEMLKYDFYTSGGHGGFKTFVEDYAKHLAANPAPATVAVN